MSDRTANRLNNTIRAAVREVSRSTPDAELLAAFVRSRDPAAFEGLVCRHGPMVLAACRAVLANPADADDACQATFVVLHRKAHTIQRPGTLGGWLIRVARRAAFEVKRATASRRNRECCAARPEPVHGPDLSWREACAILHEELDRLPAKYRLPLVSCYLEGKTRDEAATELGCSPDALRGRIDRGRAELRSRMQKRGIALSAGLLAAVIPTAAPGGVTAAIIAPSPVVAAVARTLTAASRGWSIGGGLSLAAGLLAGTIVLATGAGSPPVPPVTPSKEKLVEAAKPSPQADAFGDPLPDGASARLGTVRFNHGENLKALVYASDGKTVVSVGNGMARVWDAENGIELRHFSTGASAWDERAQITPDGKKLVLLFQEWRNDPLKEFDLASGKELRSITLPVKRSEQSADRRNALSPDGRLAALHTGEQVHVIDVESGKELCTVPKDGRDVPALAFAGHDRIVTADSSGKVTVWEARTGKNISSFDHGGPVGVVAASHDGQLLATLGHHTHAVDKFLEKDVIRIWDLTTGKRKHEFASKSGRWFMGIGFSSDAKAVHAYSVGQGTNDLTVWNTTTGKQIAELPGAVGQASAMSPDGRKLAAGANAGKFDIWKLNTGKPIAPAEVTRPWVGAVHLSRSGDRATTLGFTDIANWDATNGRQLDSISIPTHLGESAWTHISSDGRFAVIVERTEKDGQVVVWDVAAGKQAYTIPGLSYGMTMAISQDSKRIAIRAYFHGKEPTVWIRDLRTGREVLSITDPSKDYRSFLFFTNGGRALVVAGKNLVSYSLANGKAKSSFAVQPPESPSPRDTNAPPWRSIAVSADGALAAYVLAGPDGGFGRERVPNRLCLMNARTGKIIRRWGDSEDKPSRGFEKLLFSPDGRLLASSDRHDVHVWEVATGKKVRTFSGHRNEIEALSFSGNGRRLASSSWDSTVLIWDLSSVRKREPADAWAELLQEDSAAAYAAVWQLANAPDDESMPVFRKQLRPATDKDAEAMRKAIANLESNQFRIRDRAFKELSDLGHFALPALQAALARKPSAEMASRLGQLLAKVAGPPPAGESLRTWRALAALEAKGTPKAIDLLRELAAGAAESWLTAEAKASLQRIDGR
jgi:RNA polymerase sigma factor (sigma-70 family)